MVRAPLGLAFGNRADALKHLRQARTVRPGFIMIELEYARALVEDGRGAEARSVLRPIANLPEAEPGDAKRKAEAAALLGTIR
jgi:predicted Zn-dependent protease